MVLLGARWPGWGCSEPLVPCPYSRSAADSVGPGVKHVMKEEPRKSFAACGEEVWGFSHKTPEQL